LDEKVLTIGFARRAAQYKRLDLVFSDLDRLRSMARRNGKLQIIYGDKAHPKDEPGKAPIHAVFQRAEVLRRTLPVIYVEKLRRSLGRPAHRRSGSVAEHTPPGV
jgi:starch phosphorylase